MTQKNHILIVEDELLIAEDLRDVLEEIGHQVIGISKTGEEAITFSAEQDPTLILMDINLSGEIDGIEAAKQIKNRKDIPIIFLTAYATDTVIARAKLIRPSGYILKPYNEAQIRTSIEIGLYNHALERQLKERDAIIRMLVNATEDSHMLINASGTVQYINEAMGRKIGKNPDDVIGIPVEDLVMTGGLCPSVFNQLSLVKTGETIHMEEEQDENWYEYSLIPVMDTKGKVTHIGYYCHDITFHKLIERGLHDKVQDLAVERDMLEQTRQEVHRVNEELRAYNIARSAEITSIQKNMAKNQLLLSLINAGDEALKEGLDEPAFLQKTCNQIISEGKYLQAWIISISSSGIPAYMEMSNQNLINLPDFTSDDGYLRFCPALGINNTTSIIAGGDVCISCPLLAQHNGKSILTAPILDKENLIGVAGVILSSEEIQSEHDEQMVFSEICISIGFALQYMRSSDREKQALQQISKNIEMLSILNDEIRNPLSVILGMTTLDEGSHTQVIVDQVNKIDNVIKRLDGGFLESIKIYEYLKKHYDF